MDSKDRETLEALGKISPGCWLGIIFFLIAFGYLVGVAMR